MPCWIYLRSDPDEIFCTDSADTIMKRVEESDGGFIPIGAVRYAHDDDQRTGYVRAGDIVGVFPMHPREYESELDEPPDWYTEFG